MSTKKTQFILSDKVYDYLKKLVQVILPALGTAYVGLSKIWGFPSPENVLATIVVIETFLGVILLISNSNYQATEAMYDGTVTTTPTKDGSLVNLNIDPRDLVSKGSINLKVVSPPVLSE